MGDRDYFIVILLMFINLIATSFLGFRSSFVQAEIIAISVLIIINLAFVLLANRRIALAFFFISLLNMVFLFTIRPDLIFVIVALVNAFVLYYLTLIYIPSSAKRQMDDDIKSYKERDEDLFRELGIPTVEQMRQPEHSFIYPPSIFPDTHQSDYFVEKKTGQMSATEDSKTRKSEPDYVHIDELELPDAREEEPVRNYSYELYYEAPRQDITFQSIDAFEKKIEKRIAKKRR